MKFGFYLLLILGFVSCNAVNEKDNIITVSILPLKYLVEEISGNDYVVNVMVPPGIEPEIYEPLHSQVKGLTSSRLYIEVGLLEFETSLKEGILNNVSDIKMLNLSENIEIIKENHSHHDHSHSLNSDPHIWLSPINLKKFNERILSELIELNPEANEKYYQNFMILNSRIDSLNNYIQNKLRPCEERTILIYHPFLGYFCRDFNLKMLAVDHHGKEPSARQLKNLYESISNHNINSVFYQSQNNEKILKSLIDETKIAAVEIDPLKYNVIENLYELTDKIHNSLNNDR